MRIGTLDFETVDPHLTTFGSGWPLGKVKIVGASTQGIDDLHATWTDSVPEILDRVDKMDVIIAHNAQYECGLLTMLGMDLKDKIVIDTMQLAKFYNNLEINVGLEGLGKKYVGMNKGTDLIGQAVISHNLYHTSTGKNQKPGSFQTAVDYGYGHLDVIYAKEPNIVKTYCNQDVEITTKLYKKFIQHTPEAWQETMSNVTKQYTLMTKRGIDYDISKLAKVRTSLLSLLMDTEEELFSMSKMRGDPSMFNSKGTLIKILESFKLKIPVTEKGNASMTGPWLERQDHPFCKLLVKYRSLHTFLSMSVNKVFDHRDVYFPGQKGIIKIFPNYRIMSADTGRSSAIRPNIKNFPGFDKDKLDLTVQNDDTFAYLVRDCIVSTNGYVMENDYKQQEPRLFADACNKLGLPRLRNMYIENPSLDFHTVVAEIADVPRPIGKALNLAILYGKKTKATAAGLGISIEEAEVLINKYHELFPEGKTYQKSIESVGKTRGYLNLDGRKVYRPKPSPAMWEGKTYTKHWEYLLFNWYCQGRGANQIYKVMSELYKRNITPYYEVYDALGFEVSDADIHDKKKIIEIKNVMERENSFDCSVPMLVDTGIGKSWAEAKTKQGEERGKQLYVEEN